MRMEDEFAVYNGVQTKTKSGLLSKISARSAEIHAARIFGTDLTLSIGLLKVTEGMETRDV